jgi:malonyl CoA-acyl carrier protein transacylase
MATDTIIKTGHSELVDPCQAQVNAVNAAQSVVTGINNQISKLQLQLQHASPDAKPDIIKEINRLRREELFPAQAALGDARRALQTCRESNPITPVIV